MAGFSCLYLDPRGIFNYYIFTSLTPLLGIILKITMQDSLYPFSDSKWSHSLVTKGQEQINQNEGCLMFCQYHSRTSAITWCYNRGNLGLQDHLFYIPISLQSRKRNSTCWEPNANIICGGLLSQPCKVRVFRLPEAVGNSWVRATSWAI